MMSNCRNCGKVMFFTAPSYVREFCGRRCAALWQWAVPSSVIRAIVNARQIKFNKVCENCGQSFRSTNRIQRFCCRQCAYVTFITFDHRKTCGNCGQSFLARDKGKRFCSQRCSTLSRNRNYWAKFHQMHPHPDRTCLVCGKRFNVVDAPYKSKRRFCTMSCQKRYEWANPTSPIRIASVSAMRRERSHLSHSTPEMIRANRERRLRRVMPTKDTMIEVLLQKEIKERGIRFIAHIPLIVCQPDIFLPEFRLAVFADGCYWHGCPIHHPMPNAFQKRAIDKDRYQTAFLLRNGYRVSRFWEHQIKSNVRGCVDEIVNSTRVPEPMQIMKEGT